MMTDPSEVEKWLQAQRAVSEPRSKIDFTSLRTSELEDGRRFAVPQDLYVRENDAVVASEPSVMLGQKDPYRYLKSFNKLVQGG